MVTYYFEKSVRLYSLTQKGQDAVSFFSSRIPKTVREKLFNTAKQKAKDIRESSSIVAEYNKENDFEYVVTLRITERGYDLFNLSLRVGSAQIAKTICSHFKKDPENFYSGIFSTLIGDNNSEN